MKRIGFLAAVALLAAAHTARADVRTRAAQEAAEMLVARFGAGAVGKAPALASRIEALAARYGDAAIVAARKGGPRAVHLIEAAGADGPKAVRLLAVHGERGAVCVLSRPVAMRQYVKFGEGAANVLVKHPGVAEPLVERAGAAAVKALESVTQRNGRRIAIMLENDLAKVGKHPELLKVIGTFGDRAADFIWKNKGTLAGAAALTAFLANPEPFLTGASDLTRAAGEGVVEPIVGGIGTVLKVIAFVLAVVVVGTVVLIWKHGPPKVESVVGLVSMVHKKG